MGTYTIKIDEETKEGKSLLELLKNLESVEIESEEESSDWEDMTEEEENEILAKIGQEALDDPNNTRIEIQGSITDYLDKLWK